MQHSAQGVSSLQEFKSLIDSRQGHVVGYELINAELLHTEENVNNLQNQKLSLYFKTCGVLIEITVSKQVDSFCCLKTCQQS